MDAGEKPIEAIMPGGAVVGTEYYGYDGHGKVALLTDSTGTGGNTSIRTIRTTPLVGSQPHGMCHQF